MPKKPDPVDALLKSGPRRTHLPGPAERARLRGDYGLTQAEVAAALDVTRATVAGWESGRSEPQGATRAAYAKLLEGITAQLAPAEPESGPRAQPEPVRTAAPAPVQDPAPESSAAPTTAPAPPPPASPATPAPAPAVARRRPAPKNTAPRRPASAPTSQLPAPEPQFANGPLAVLDGDGSAYCVGGLVLTCPAKDIPALVEWALTDAALGAPRLDRHGRDSDPLIVLTESAALRLGLPPVLEDRRGLRLPDDHKVNKQVARAKWTLTKRGFGPWARIYRPAREGRRQCVQLAVLPWDALDQRGWPGAAALPPAELARVLGTYAARVITPCGSTAVSGLELMTALRPPTRPVRDTATGTWTSGPVPGSLTRAVDPAPPEAPDEHPVVAALHPRGHWRTPDEVIDEEAHDWIRDPQLLTDAECARKYAVGIDVNTAFLAAANRLSVGLGEPVHLTSPDFDKSVPGSWLIDLSGIEMDPRLPSPFTPRGSRPTGPAWYATPTVAYAHELVTTYGLPVIPRPLEAWVRPECGPYLDPWYKRLADAYRTTMAELGVTTDLDEHGFLAAMEHHKRSDPGAAAVLAAIKSTVKGGIGKLRERPQGAAYRPGERWPALKRPTWRPDIRAAVIATARVNMHRKLVRTAVATQSAPPPAGRLHFEDDALLPVALLSDGVVFLSDSPSPLDLLPRTADGRPAPGTFRLGVSPGMVKHEGTQSLLWAAQLLDEGLNPARHIKDGVDAVAEGGVSAVGIIGDSITKAAENTATRPIPKSAGARMRFLVKKEKGSTRAVARRLGCTQRTVERYLKGDLKRPRAALAERLAAEVRKDWQPRIRKEAMTKAATSTGIVVETRARFGFTAAVGSTDDPRMRRITELLPPQVAARLLTAHETGADEGELRGIVAEGLQEQYFKDNGRRATGLEVEFTDLDYVEMGL